MLGNDQDIYELERLGNLEMFLDVVQLRESSSINLTSNMDEESNNNLFRIGNNLNLQDRFAVGESSLKSMVKQKSMNDLWTPHLFSSGISSNAKNI